jgi:hypothetical protein
MMCDSASRIMVGIMIVSKSDRLKKFKEGWPSDGETLCGTGSTKARTKHVVNWLPSLVKKYDIKVVNDAGAGDLNWISAVKWDVDYQGYDIYPRHPDVIKLDIANKRMRKCDLIISKMVMVHMSKEDNIKFIELARKTAKYLLATNYHSPKRKDPDSLFHHVNLKDYGLSDPIDKIRDTNNMCDLALYEL